MNRASTAMVWIAVILLFGAFLFPLWNISLSAPQYPEGMGMRIWVDKITGQKPHDLQNINGLNHYIGMKQIHAESIPELSYMKFIVMGLIGLGIVAGIARKRAVLAAWVVIAILLAVVGLIDFYKWGYDYGHDLNPEAAIKVPGMTYQPPLLGSKKLLNITATSLPALGGIMMMSAVALGFLALFLEWRRTRRRPTGSGVKLPKSVEMVTALLVGVVALSSCSPQAKPIAYGTDACHYCMMTIVNEQYGAEIVTQKGRVYTYDSVECMVSAIVTRKVDPATIAMTLATDYARPRQLVDARALVFLHSGALRSPMGMNLTAFADQAAASRYPGDILTWEETLDFTKGNLAERSKP